MTTPDPQLLEFSPAELRRYSRHLILPEVGVAGQQKLKAASVLIIGAGGLGSPVALYLAAAGVGTLGLVDYDVVDETNLQRQIAHGTANLGQRKVESARARLLDINPHIAVLAHAAPFTSANALELARPYDVLVDCTDNFPTRYLSNDVCVLLGKPNVYGSVYQFEGQASVFYAKAGPCYRCLFPEPPPPAVTPTCAESGVLGVLPGFIGLIQATETLKLLLGVGQTLVGRLLVYDALTMTLEEIRLKKNPRCVICSEHPTLDHLIDYEQFCGSPAHDLAWAAWEIAPGELAARLADRQAPPVRLIDVREPFEWQIAHLPGAEHIPLDLLPERWAALAPETEIVLYCRTGRRAEEALALLREAGFSRLKHLKGGILAWARQVDPMMPVY